MAGVNTKQFQVCSLNFAEVGIANFFLSLLIANPLIYF
jgi:hypothetical protein